MTNLLGKNKSRELFGVRGFGLESLRCYLGLTHKLRRAATPEEVAVIKGEAKSRARHMRRVDDALSQGPVSITREAKNQIDPMRISARCWRL
jgi:5-enolpyruvylshikimate-3-phosphate synthase